MTARPTRLVLLGHPVDHSLSPALQNAALRSAGLPLEYETLDVEPGALGATLRALRDSGAAGNVTRPYKEEAAEQCDVLTPLARRVGAVNTFWARDGLLHGDNTDVGGVFAAIRELLGHEPEGMRVSILGAGGAAAAVLAAAERWAGCEVTLWGRSPARVEALLARFPGVRRASTCAASVAQAMLVVNATPLGLSGTEMPVEPSMLHPRAAALDLAYRRGGTPWVQALLERGHRAADGHSTLLEQGALAFEQWFGVTPDRAAMRRALA